MRFNEFIRKHLNIKDVSEQMDCKYCFTENSIAVLIEWVWETGKKMHLSVVHAWYDDGREWKTSKQ